MNISYHPRSSDSSTTRPSSTNNRPVRDSEGQQAKEKEDREKIQVLRRGVEGARGRQATCEKIFQILRNPIHILFFIPRITMVTEKYDPPSTPKAPNLGVKRTSHSHPFTSSNHTAPSLPPQIICFKRPKKRRPMVCPFPSSCHRPPTSSPQKLIG